MLRSQFVAVVFGSLLCASCISKGKTVIGDHDDEVDQTTSGNDSSDGATDPSETATLADDEPSPIPNPSVPADDEPATSTPPDDVEPTGTCATNNGGCDPATECSDSPLGPVCSPCPEGSIGSGLEGCTPLCEDDTCFNGGTCTVENNDFLCECVDGFNGTHCENEPFVELAAGGSNVCGRRASGEVQCWGGPGGANDAPADEVFTQISVGSGHACGVLEDQTVLCWGENTSSEAVSPDATFVSVSAGPASTCGIKTDGTLLCWGAPLGGLETPTDEGFTQLALGSSNGCAILQENDELLCWGSENNGFTNVPQGVYQQVAIGSAAVCAINLDDELLCWGIPGSAILSGAEDLTGTFSHVEVGDNHACALRTDGMVSCWGVDRAEIAGDSLSPPPYTFEQLTCGDNSCCGIRTSGEVACWGNDFYGETNPP
jgi:alpha-tubulin suppressor-like RCC1 family protein